jgi:hypothetical protein
MKKLLIFIKVLCFAMVLNGQTNALDDFFSKYSEREGFTAVTISGKLLGLLSDKNVKADENDIINRLTSIRILSVEDSVLSQSFNFYKELKNKIDLSVYEELMDVRDGSETSKFLIRQKGEIISELLMISGGPGNNTVICIKGNLDLKSLSELSDETGFNELRDLESIEKKKEGE